MSEPNRKDILHLIENAERGALPIYRSTFAGENEVSLAGSVLELAEALRLSLGFPERPENY